MTEEILTPYSDIADNVAEEVADLQKVGKSVDGEVIKDFISETEKEAKKVAKFEKITDEKYRQELKGLTTDETASIEKSIDKEWAKSNLYEFSEFLTQRPEYLKYFRGKYGIEEQSKIFKRQLRHGTYYNEAPEE